MSSTTAPTTPNQRIIALDVLRGFALLGILIMNIQDFSMPGAAYFIPTVYGDLTGLNLWVWNLSHLFADQKFITLFSILFGAGIILMTSKIEAKGQSSAAIHYRRNFWLLLIGMAHAYLIWSGDILVAYAICSYLIYFLRHQPPRRLLIIGLVMFAIGPILMLLSSVSLQFAPPEIVAEVVAEWQPAPAEIEAELAAYRGGWLTQMEARVPGAFYMQTLAFFFWTLWRAGGLMLVGMALYKWGVLSAQRSARFYIGLMIGGLGIGLPIVAYGIVQKFAYDWEPIYATMGMGYQYNYWASLLVSLGYIGIVMLIVQRGYLMAIQNRLAAVGRMALTNYLLQSIIATAIFYGHGLGLHGSIERTGQILIVIAIWLLQLIISPLWLRRFAFGPAEWFWRTLTYWRLQKMSV